MHSQADLVSRILWPSPPAHPSLPRSLSRSLLMFCTFYVCVHFILPSASKTKLKEQKLSRCVLFSAVVDYWQKFARVRRERARVQGLCGSALTTQLPLYSISMFCSYLSPFLSIYLSIYLSICLLDHRITALVKTSFLGSLRTCENLKLTRHPVERNLSKMQ